MRRIFGGLPPVSYDEELLFRDIVARAVLDAVGVTGAAEIKQHNDIVRTARIWLRFGEDRDEFFDHAGLEVSAIVAPVLGLDPPYKKE